MTKKQLLETTSDQAVPGHDPITGEIPEYFREEGAQQRYLNDRGQEVLDPRPMAPPIGYKKQPSMVEIVRQQILSARLAEEAEAAGMETFDEADDFDVSDDFDPSSPYEEIFDPAPPQARYRTAEEELDSRRPHRKPATAPAEPQEPAPPPDGPRPPAKKAAAPAAPPSPPEAD